MHPRGVLPYASRDADAAGFRQGLEPARNIHTITKDVTVLSHDGTLVDADART
jgi:hypothetical protein